MATNYAPDIKSIVLTPNTYGAQGKALELSLDNTRRNLMVDPSFEGDPTITSQPNGVGVISSSTTWSDTGTKSLKLVTPGTNAYDGALVNYNFSNGYWGVPALAGDVFSFQCAIYCPTVPAQAQVQIGISWNDVNGGFISGQPLGNGAVNISPMPGVVHRVKFEGFTVGANASIRYIYPVVVFQKDDSTALAGTVYMDSFQLEKAATCSPYRDGDTPGYQWDGYTGTTASTKPSTPTTVAFSQSSSPIPGVGILAKDGLDLPEPVYDEVFADGADVENAQRTRSTPKNSTGKIRTLITADDDTTFWNRVRLWETTIEAARDRPGATLAVTPENGSEVFYDLESVRITAMPSDNISLAGRAAIAEFEFTSAPFARLADTTAQLIDIDTFQRDTIKNGEWVPTAGSGLVITGGLLGATSTGEKQMFRPIRTGDVTNSYIQFRTGSSVGGSWWVGPNLKAPALSGNNMIRMLEISGSLQVYVTIATVQTGPFSSTTTTLAANTNYWLQTTLIGNVITGKIWNADPLGSVTPTQIGGTCTYTLTGAEATNFGAGTIGHLGLSFNPPAANEWTVDSFRVESPIMENGTGAAGDIALPFSISVPGSSTALMNMTVTDTSGVDHRHLEYGVDDRFFLKSNPQPTRIIANSLSVAGLSGVGQNGPAQTFNPTGSGIGVYRATLSTNRSAIVSTGVTQHVGPKRLKARCYVGATGTPVGDVYVRLAHRLGDGPWDRTLPWAKVPISGWYEVDLGVVDIPEMASGSGAQAWEGRLEAYSQTNGDVLDVNYIEILPAKKFGTAIAPTDVGISSFLVAERFLQSIGDLSGKAVGGNATQAQGPRNAASNADIASGGTVAWTAGSNAYTFGGGEAVCDAGVVAAYAVYGHYLRLTNFGFAIPTGASPVITGIQFDVRRRAYANESVTSGNLHCRDLYVRAVKGGTEVGSARERQDVEWPTSSAYFTYGGPTDLWGTSWNVTTEINNSGFGIQVAPQTWINGGFGIAQTWYIDHMQATVYYTDTTGNTWNVYNSAGTNGQTDWDCGGPGFEYAWRNTVSDASTGAGRWAIVGGHNQAYTNIGAAVTVVKFDQAVGAGEAYQGGLILREVDVNNCLFILYDLTMTSTPSNYISVYKKIGGVQTLMKKVGFPGSLAGGSRLWAQVYADGSYYVWSGAPGLPQLVIAGSDPLLATGGTLDNGSIGMRDVKLGATATERRYDDFEAWIPDSIPNLIGANSTISVKSDSIVKPSGSRIYPIGAYPKAGASGSEAKLIQVAVKSRRTDVSQTTDDNPTDGVRAGIVLTPRVPLF